MKQICLALLLSIAVAVPAGADVTIKMTTGGKGMGMARSTTGTTYIKGNRMRSDLQMGNRTQTTIFDLDAQKMYIFESGRKEADVWDMAEFGKQIGMSIDADNMKTSITPNGQKKPFGSYTADGYDMEVSVPATMGNSKDMAMTVTLSGPVWIVKDAPGAAEYNNFYRAAAEKGWIFGDPRAAKGQPGQAKAMAEMYRQFAEIGGIAYESDIQIKMGMSGAPAGGPGGLMAGMLAKMGNMSAQTKVEDVQTGPLSDDLFAPPAGYTLNSRK
ncbi:MAG TPA: hypothetical protein VMO26_08265 [Vicinamibacterales bacterium]|nr:hypothetical protein [Vicinamibacterales bacterium]